MEQSQVSDQATASFTGTRWRLAGILLFGYILMLPTLGIYRFWQVTRKRRFYWSHTEIDGDALEYTGTAVQLLIGFLFALAIFLPLYGLFFYLSTQSPEATLYGYSGAAIFLFFLSGYAIYRARRFRLTRTLWRGIRFHQTGSAWAYAFRRFLWFIATAATGGLIYPFMSASLWKYRYNNTWYGDRKFTFNGSWRTIAFPFYANYVLFVGLIIGAIVVADFPNNEKMSPEVFITTPAAGLFAAAMFVGSLSYFYLLSRFTSRMLSSVSAGNATLYVRVKARSLFGQYVLYAIMFSLTVTAFTLAAVFLMGNLIEPMMADEQVELSEILQIGWYNLFIFGLLYLGLLAAFSILIETILGLGFWRLVTRGAVIENASDLKSVRAGGEESPLAGEGLADALNVGAY